MRLHQRADDNPSRITVKAAIVAALRLAAERIDQIAQGPSFPLKVLSALRYAGLRRHFGRCFLLLGHKRPRSNYPARFNARERNEFRPAGRSLPAAQIMRRQEFARTVSPAAQRRVESAAGM